MAQTRKDFIGRSPYADGASSAREHKRLVQKGIDLANAMREARAALGWDTPQQAPFNGIEDNSQAYRAFNARFYK